MADRWADLVRRAKAGDRKAAAELIQGNLGLVHRAARKLDRYHVAHEDLVAEGVLGLLEAIHAHDPSRGTAYTTTATYWIRLRQMAAVRAEHSRGTCGRGQLAGQLWWSLPRMWDEVQLEADPVAALIDRIAATGCRRHPTRHDALAAVQLTTCPAVEIDTHDQWDLAAHSNPASEFEREETAHLVRQAVLRLQPEEREIVARTVMGDESMTEVVGSERNCAKERGRRRRRRRKALKRLRCQLREAA